MPAGQVGKTVAFHKYVHVSAARALNARQRAAVRRASELAREFWPRFRFNVVKVHKDDTWPVSLLDYVGIGNLGHPVLANSMTVHRNGRIAWRQYSMNRPVLHQVELFLSPRHKSRRAYEELTAAEEAAGLLRCPPGREYTWNGHLEKRGYRVEGLRLLPISG